MESSGSSRSGLLTAGEVLSIIGGVVEVIGGGIVLVIVGHITVGGPLQPIPHIPWMPNLEIWLVFFPGRVATVGILIMVLGAIGIAGGISAMGRKSYGLSLAGAICILPTVIFGILAVIFVAVSKREFSMELKGNGIAGRSWLPVAGGVLSIIGGVVEWVGIGAWDVLLSYWGMHNWVLRIVAVVLIILGLMSITGGILAVRRKGYNVSLVGAICALPSTIFGILAFIFIVLGKSEFEVEESASW